MTEWHTIEPVFDERSKILILGSFPSPKSRETGFYYGHPKNRVWYTLSSVLGIPCPVTIDEKRALLSSRGIAVWDVIASCDIVGAGDSTIKNAVPNDFDQVFSVADIRQVFTTGKTATALYKKFTGNDSVCLPSPSPANCAVSQEKLTEEYRVILPYLEEK